MRNLSENWRVQLVIPGRVLEEYYTADRSVLVDHYLGVFNRLKDQPLGAYILVQHRADGASRYVDCELIPPGTKVNYKDDLGEPSVMVVESTFIDVFGEPSVQVAGLTPSRPVTFKLKNLKVVPPLDLDEDKPRDP